MSHYALAVFHTHDQVIEELLAPYDENMEVEEYVSLAREQLIEREKQLLQQIAKSYAEWKADPAAYEAKCVNPDHIPFIRTAGELASFSENEIYQRAIDGYDPERITPEGGVLSTYNPDSKWDWWVIGGRFSKWLIFKNVNMAVRRILMPDSGMVSEIDFDAMKKEATENLQPYNEAMTTSFFKEEYMRTLYPTSEEYAQRKTGFSTFAVVTPDGEWHAPGEIGPFGWHSAAPNELREWEMQYHDRFIKPAIENRWMLTIVDCHI